LYQSIARAPAVATWAAEEIPMINGAHAIVYSTDAEADRAFLRDVLGLDHVDAGNGWLIFGLPPAEVAVHPGEHNDAHELYLMCDDVEAFVVALGARNVGCSAIEDRGWGRLTSVMLPGGGKLGVYQPRHPRPPAAAPAARPPASRAKKLAKKKPTAKPQKKKTAKPAAKPSRRPAAKRASVKPATRRKPARR
jgi:hypothetical protein